MICDKFGKEFSYGNFVTYTVNGEMKLAKVKKIVLSRTNYLVCIISQYNYPHTVTLKKLQNVEIITELYAKVLFPEKYQVIKHSNTVDLYA
jgi:hypothetical protein